MRHEDLPYRRNVGIMLLNHRSEVFVGRRRAEAGPEHVDATHSWQMPQGGIDAGEDPYPAALRELAEETGVTTVSLLAEAPDWLTYDLPPDVAKAAWKGKYRGQTQKWFAFRFEGDDWDALRWLYTQSGCKFVRKDLGTLLNNWQGEIDRAKNYDPNEK